MYQFLLSQAIHRIIIMYSIYDYDCDYDSDYDSDSDYDYD